MGFSQSIKTIRDPSTGLYRVSIDGEHCSEYGLEGVDICFMDPDDAKALTELLERATSIVF